MLVKLGSPRTSDNCKGTSVTQDYRDGYFPVGATTVTWTVVDAAGLRTSCTQKVKVSKGMLWRWVGGEGGEDFEEGGEEINEWYREEGGGRSGGKGGRGGWWS